MAGLKFSEQRKSLLSSQARIQVPWIKVVIGNYTFGVFNKATKQNIMDDNGFYIAGQYGVQYPNYIQSLSITKINGQVNQYTLQIIYPITQNDDPNFFEKVFSSVSATRKITFSYGDVSMPAYIYKDEEAIITKIIQIFDLQGGRITYNVSATSGAALGKSGSYCFPRYKNSQPSAIIYKMLTNNDYGLLELFTGMNTKNIKSLICYGQDKPVELEAKKNISALDYVNYLVGCMIPAGNTTGNTTQDMFILTIHDDTNYDQFYDGNTVQGEDYASLLSSASDTVSTTVTTKLSGPYFKISRVSKDVEQSDAYNIDIGYNTSTIVTEFSLEQNENYSILYDYQSELSQEQYVRRLDANGNWYDEYAPNISSKTTLRHTSADDISWWTKITKYPVNATITVQGLLRPATLMTYIRLNVMFVGGHKHISSGLYLVTKQVDKIDSNGYKTTLSLTKISGDNDPDYIV